MCTSRVSARSWLRMGALPLMRFGEWDTDFGYVRNEVMDFMEKCSIRMAFLLEKCIFARRNHIEKCKKPCCTGRLDHTLKTI